jgi:large subunit ribosomal protein L31
MQFLPIFQRFLHKTTKSGKIKTFTFSNISDIISLIMSKKELHPKEYRFVVFSDEAANFSFLTKSTAKSEETIKWKDGNEYPLVKIQISSASHPFFTGEEKIIDTEGRVDRFKARAAKAAKMKEALENKAKKAAKEAEKKAKAEEK